MRCAAALELLPPIECTGARPHLAPCAAHEPVRAPSRRCAPVRTVHMRVTTKSASRTELSSFSQNLSKSDTSSVVGSVRVPVRVIVSAVGTVEVRVDDLLTPLPVLVVCQNAAAAKLDESL